MFVADLLSLLERHKWKDSAFQVWALVQTHLRQIAVATIGLRRHANAQSVLPIVGIELLASCFKKRFMCSTYIDPRTLIT